jgi:hypothetical protein
LVKGGVAVLTAGALVAGTAAVHQQAPRPAHHWGARTTADQRRPGTAADQRARTQHQGPGSSPGLPAKPLRAHDSQPKSAVGNVGHAGAGGMNALSNPATGSVRAGRLTASFGPVHQPTSGGRLELQSGSSAGEPQTAGKTRPRGTVPETPPDSATGRGPSSSGSQHAGDNAAETGVPTGAGSGGQRGPPGSNDRSDGEAGLAVAGSAGAASGDPESANARTAKAESDEAEGGAGGSGGEARSGGRGASGPTAYASSSPDSARAASTGPTANAGAVPQGDS